MHLLYVTSCNQFFELLEFVGFILKEWSSSSHLLLDNIPDSMVDSGCTKGVWILIRLIIKKFPYTLSSVG